MSPADLPDSVARLDALLSEPSEQVIQTMRDVQGDVIVLGVGGKMGPTFAAMIKRASDLAGTPRRVLGVSRFSSGELRAQLDNQGIETIQCDLLDEDAFSKLPDADNVVSMLGFKFGAATKPSMTWAMNCYLPAVVAQRYRQSRIAAFSSGNIYGNVAVDSGGSLETDPLNPVGEYAQTVLGRERMYDHFSRVQQTPISILRLNYATEMRYGVLVDLALQVMRGTTIDVTMGHVNVIWQRDANAMAINSLKHTESPPKILNIAGREVLNIRLVCEQFGQLMNKPVKFSGTESDDALLNHAQHNYPLLGEPSKSADELIRWTAQWISEGRPTLGKPTHFENRAGNF